MNRLIETIRYIHKRITDHKVTVYAAQATLFVTISALPLTMLVISLIKYIIPFNRSDVAGFIGAFVPPVLHTAMSTVLDEIFCTAGAPAISISSIAVVWSASKGMMALVQGLESVYETTEKRGYIKTRLFALVYTLVFVVVIIATLLFFLAGKYIINVLSGKIPFLAVAARFTTAFPVVVYIAVLTLVFALLYKMLPGKGFTFIHQLKGALFSSAGWVVFSVLYSFYINRFANYSYIYGSLTAVVLSILWLYFCMNIFLMGAELNCFLTERKEKHIER